MTTIVFRDAFFNCARCGEPVTGIRSERIELPWDDYSAPRPTQRGMTWWEPCGHVPSAAEYEAARELAIKQLEGG